MEDKDKEEMSKSQTNISCDVNVNVADEMCNNDSANIDEKSTLSNLNSDEIDNKTISKLRGDAIGDTMYSESFVVRTLLKLSDLVWNEQLEEDLCFLWDMTVEKEVCDYLLKLSFPSIACGTLLKYEEQRLIEIIVGILANIYSASCTFNMTDREIDVALSALNTDDHLILIQVMRLFKTIVYHKDGQLDFVTSDIVDKIDFILRNSNNKDLLMVTLDVVSKLTLDFKVEERLLKGELVNSCLMAHSVIFDSENVVLDEYETESIDLRSSFTHLIQTILNVCCYINRLNDRLLTEIIPHNDKLVVEFDRLFEYLVNEGNLIPVADDLLFCVDAFTIIFPTLGLRYHSKYFLKLIQMIKHLHENEIEEIHSFIDLARFLISVGTVDQISLDLSTSGCNHMVCLKVILEHKSECEYEYKDKTVMIIDKYKK